MTTQADVYDALRRALADLPKIEHWFVVGPPWGKGDFVVAGHPDPHLGRYVADTEDFDGEGEDVLEHAAFIAATNPAVIAALLAERDALSQAARDVLAERRRQVDAEGWTPEHDDEHSMGTLAEAAACYALGKHAISTGRPYNTFVTLWPWDMGWWKPTPNNRRRELIKAGALILAEIERLDRAAHRSQVREGAHGNL